MLSDQENAPSAEESPKGLVTSVVLAGAAWIAWTFVIIGFMCLVIFLFGHRDLGRDISVPKETAVLIWASTKYSHTLFMTNLCLLLFNLWVAFRLSVRPTGLRMFLAILLLEHLLLLPILVVSVMYLMKPFEILLFNLAYQPSRLSSGLLNSALILGAVSFVGALFVALKRWRHKASRGTRV